METSNVFPPPSIMQERVFHRVYPGSPLKFSTPKRLFHTALTQNSSIYKGKKIHVEEELSPGEIFLTHTKTIATDSDFSHALARIGVSEGVLISEALHVLTAEVDEHFLALSNMSEFAEDASRIMGSVLKRGYSFPTFAHGICKACKDKDSDEDLYAAVVRSGVKLFWEVLENVAEEHPDNESFQQMANCSKDSEFEILRTWSQLYDYVHHRNKVSHPFKFVGGDVEFAEAALDILRFRVQQSEAKLKYGGIIDMLKASIPMLSKNISVQKLKATALKRDEEQLYELVRQRLPERMR